MPIQNFGGEQRIPTYGSICLRAIRENRTGTIYPNICNWSCRNTGNFNQEERVRWMVPASGLTSSRDSVNTMNIGLASAVTSRLEVPNARSGENTTGIELSLDANRLNSLANCPE